MEVSTGSLLQVPLARQLLHTVAAACLSKAKFDKVLTRHAKRMVKS